MPATQVSRTASRTSPVAVYTLEAWRSADPMERRVGDVALSMVRRQLVLAFAAAGHRPRIRQRCEDVGRRVEP